jgi:general nucleoside transport system permease protein
MLRLVPRREPSRALRLLAPLLAIGLTIIAGFILFTLLGKDPVRGMGLVFVTPLTSWRSVGELLVKATPLILIALGLAVGFRAGIWNIGAEGQFTVGAITGGAVGLYFHPGGGPLLLPLMALAGIAGGMAWAAIPALLKTRFNANEILVSLMLVYIATLLLSAMCHGPLRDPGSFNFPESKLFQPAATLPTLWQGTRAHAGFFVAMIIAVLAYVILTRHRFGFEIDVAGQAPDAARYAGISDKRLTWLCLMISGGLAGLAGLFEAAGPVGQLVPALPVGYGFTAIIVAFLGRLDPLGIVLAGFVMALTYIGGETAQIAMSLPSATTAVFQGFLLFFLLAVDVLVRYRIAIGRARSQPGGAQP